MNLALIAQKKRSPVATQGVWELAQDIVGARIDVAMAGNEDRAKK